MPSPPDWSRAVAAAVLVTIADGRFITAEEGHNGIQIHQFVNMKLHKTIRQNEII
jgi:hypothetical protein